jgi:hypothetical protein
MKAGAVQAQCRLRSTCTAPPPRSRLLRSLMAMSASPACFSDRGSMASRSSSAASCSRGAGCPPPPPPPPPPPRCAHCCCCCPLPCAADAGGGAAGCCRNWARAAAAAGCSGCLRLGLRHAAGPGAGASLFVIRHPDPRLLQISSCSSFTSHANDRHTQPPHERHTQQRTLVVPAFPPPRVLRLRLWAWVVRGCVC